MGIAYAVYWPAIPSEKIAESAVGPANASRPSASATSAVAQTAFTGVCVRACTRRSVRESGSAPSRAKAHIWREAAVSCPACGVVRMMR